MKRMLSFLMVLLISMVHGPFISASFANTDTTVVQIKTYNVINQDSELEEVGKGSASFIPQEGVILTPAHFLHDDQGQQADIIEVCYLDGSFSDPECPEIAEVIAYDSNKTLALLSPIARYNDTTEQYEDVVQTHSIGSVASTEALLANQSTVSIFTDVNNTTQYAAAIQFLKDNNIVGGYPDGSFKPSNTINRAEFVKILIEAVFPEATIDQCVSLLSELFSDVPPEQWFTKYICMAKRYGIVGGYPDGTFGPGNTINFAEAAKIIVNTLKISFKAPLENEPWYSSFITALLDENAVPDTLLDPGQNITRGEMAEMIFRLQKYLQTAAENHSPVEGLSELPTGIIGDLQEQIILLVNEERAKEGLSPMSYNARLHQSAQAHSDDMREQDFFDHNSLDGRTPDQRIQEAGYLRTYDNCNCNKRSSTGENIAKGQSTAEEVMETWMNSPLHRANILDPDFDEIGIGITAVDPADTQFEGYFWVQNFGFIELNISS